MAYLAIDKSGVEVLSTTQPERDLERWSIENEGRFIELPKGSIKKLTGKNLTWDNEPIGI